MAGRRPGAHPPVRPAPAPPVLTAYCQAYALHEDAIAAIRRDGPVRADGRASAWLTVLEKSQRAMVAMSMRLRLSPQARRERAVAPKRLDWMARRLLQQEAEHESE